MKAVVASLAFFTLALPTELLSQAKTHTTTVPEFFTGTNGTGINWFPMGRTRGFFQLWYRGDLVPTGRPVFVEIGWRVSPRATSAPATAHRMEVTLGNTSKTFSNLSKTFAQNLGTATKFVGLKTINFPAVTKPPSDPEKPALWIKGDRPFLWRGPNLILQVDIQTSTAFNYVRNYYADGYTSRSSLHAVTDKSCGGSLTAGYSGGRWSLNLTGAPSSGVALFLIGLHRLPVDVGVIFGKGCTAVVNPIFILGVPLSGGSASFSVPYTPTTDTLVLYAQAIHSGSPIFATSNATHSMIGTRGFSTYLYNWTQNGTTAQSGPFSTNRGIVMLVR